ncbi:sorting nexin-14-like [Ostrinia nubilalis]|uniref:sorting nexin-14-like n=1 Tax=Ostrinia nubilalis TaxID=29057 RepID=UPI0030824CD2
METKVFRVLIREIFAGWVLLSLTDVLADPYILNTLIVLATGDETMAQLPTTPNYKVEFLERFARHTESVYSQRPKLLKVDLEWVISDQDYFYAFMQHLKATSHIHLLQFYKDIKLFQTKLLNPDLDSSEQAALLQEARDMYELYLSPRSLSAVPLDASIAAELHDILHSAHSIKRQARDMYELYLSPRSLSAVPLDASIAAELHDILHSAHSIKRNTMRTLAAMSQQARDMYQLYLSPRSLSAVPLDASIAAELHDILHSAHSIKRNTMRTLAAMSQQARDMYELYLSPRSLSAVPLDASIAAELHDILHSAHSIKRNTMRTLAAMSQQARDMYELYLSPRSLSAVPLDASIAAELHDILHSAHSIKRPQERLLQTALKLGNRLKGALRPQTIDGQVLDCFTNSEDSEGDGGENMDILKYLESLANEDSLREQDLSTYKVVLTNVETRLQAPPRRGTVRVFTLAVHRAAPGAAPRLWALDRSEHDFHLLRAKLLEFHGDKLLHELALPSRSYLRSVVVELMFTLAALGAAPRLWALDRSEHDFHLLKAKLLEFHGDKLLHELALPSRSYLRSVVELMFTLAALGAAPRLWALDRSEHDFHLLRAKLLEFHGDKLLHELALPSRRDNSPMETLRYKYEDFLQRLLQKSLLQTSELLHLFLTVDGDFSMVVQASTLNANSSDLANIYQSVTHKLRKEKGQHLESFLKNLLVSSDIDRYQALKQGTARDVEEAIEVSEEADTIPLQRPRRARDITDSVFGDNFGVPPSACHSGDIRHQNAVCGFTQCAMFLLVKVVKARGFVTAIAGSVFCVTRELVDDAFDALLNKALCRLLSERRLAHLIRLGHGLLFGKKASTPRTDPARQRELARTQLLQSIPSPAVLIAGNGLPVAVHKAFEIIQRPQLNKQLVYNLLDLCLMELFPELGASTEPSKEPKS